MSGGSSVSGPGWNSADAVWDKAKQQQIGYSVLDSLSLELGMSSPSLS